MQKENEDIHKKSNEFDKERNELSKEIMILKEVLKNANEELMETY